MPPDQFDGVEAMAKRMGFALAGVAQARPSEHARAVREWIAAGCHGEMGYLAEHLEMKLDPAKLLPGCRSVIALADAYPDDPGPGALSEATWGFPHGRIARYAWGDDYHKTIKKRLHRFADALRDAFPASEACDAPRFRCTVDTAPALEREHAVRAGLGWQAKNTMLIHPRHGSYTLIGLILTTLDFPPSTPSPAPAPGSAPGSDPANDSGGDRGSDRSTPAARAGATDPCGTCTRCIDACPTDAIDPAGYRLDATRCISYLTLEHRSEIDPALQPAMGNWIAGCDICQEVCPHNTKPGRVPLPIHPRYAPRPPAPAIDLMELLGWDADDRREAFTGSALKRLKLDMLKRNALIAAGNTLAEGAEGQGRPALRRRIAEIADDPAEPDLVRTTAEQVLDRLASPR